MDVEAKYDAWFGMLDKEQRSEALALVGGELPEWMVESLREAGVPVIAAELSEGQSVHDVFLMPTRLMEFLTSQRG